MPDKFTLGKNERLKRRKIIDQVFNEGKSITLFPLKVHYMFCQSLTDPLQAGFTVSSRQFKKAVDRNRIKRLLREAYRLQKASLQQMLQQNQQQLALFVIYIGKELPDFQLISDKTKQVLNKLISIVNENASSAS
jgi:ribonuclease P protein component